MLLESQAHGKWQRAEEQDNERIEIGANKRDLNYTLITSFRAERSTNGRLISTIKRGRIATFEDVRVDDRVWIKDQVSRDFKLIECRVVNVEHRYDTLNPSKLLSYCDIEMLGV